MCIYIPVVRYKQTYVKFVLAQRQLAESLLLLLWLLPLLQPLREKTVSESSKSR